MTDRELLEEALKLVAKYHARETILVDWEKSVIEAINTRLNEPERKLTDEEIKTLWVENLITVSEEQVYQVRPCYRAPDQWRGRVTFKEWWDRDYGGSTCRDCSNDAWKTALAAERERIRSRVKDTAERFWCIRNQGDELPYGLYIGPPLNTLEQFVEKLMEE